MTVFSRKGSNNKYSRHPLQYCVSVLLLLAVPMATFLVAELAMDLGCDISSLGRYKIVLNYLLYGMIEAVLFAFTLSVRFAVTGGAVLGSFFAFVIIYVNKFTYMPLYATDLVNAGTAIGVLGNYKITIERGVIILLAYCIVIFIICLLVKPVYFPKRWVIRCLLIPLTAVSVIWLCRYTAFGKGPARHGVKVSTYRPAKTYVSNGGLLAFVRSFKLLKIDIPDGYSLEEVAKLEEAYPSDTAGTGEKLRPNVIVIMNEAFADLQDVGSFETSEPVMPFYDSMTNNVIKGVAYTSVFGGHTANTEYEFLSGDSGGFLPNGATAYQVYIKSAFPGLTSLLKQNGYHGNIALHPFNPNGYNRYRVYSWMGFDKFLSEGDFTDPVLIRNYISDESDYDKIISEYEQSKTESDEPFYLFTVTMQNHGGYTEDFDNLPMDISITTEGIDYPEAERYLNLVHISDASTAELISYFEKKDDPTVIVMFGDHQPGLSTHFYNTILQRKTGKLSAEEKMCMYNTPFFIWANFDIEEKTDVRTSVNYLQSIMMEAAGMDMSGYNKYLLAQMEAVPQIAAGGYWGDNGVYYDVGDKDSPYYDWVRSYRILCYNHLFDTKNRSSIFELKE